MPRFLSRLGPVGLRTHAVIVSASMIALTTLLGARAYSVARSHSEETRELLSQDLRAQTALLRIDAIISVRDQTRRKLGITGDPAYARLAVRHAGALQQARRELKEALGPVGPELAAAAPPPEALDSPEDVKKFIRALETRRELKLRHAQQDALGLVRLIVIALGLSIGITAWQLLLFFRGLIEPLRALDSATDMLRGGDLTHRLPADGGVAELRSLSRSFNAMAERLETLDHAKADFLATISHEINNPLTALKEGLNLLAVQGEELSPSDRSKGFCACLIATKRLESIINNLLKLSRGEKGFWDLPEVAPKNLRLAIQTAIDEVRPLAARKGMSFRFEPVQELQASFHWDGIVQVFENLLLNAIKYGGEQTRIDIDARAESRPLKSGSGPDVPHLAVDVVNSGKEIPPTEASRIFERFYRGSNSRRQQGLGIGLHVVKQIIEAHQGQVVATSGAGQTRFRLWIPLDPDAARGAPA